MSTKLQHFGKGDSISVKHQTISVGSDGSAVGKLLLMVTVPCTET